MVVEERLVLGERGEGRRRKEKKKKRKKNLAGKFGHSEKYNYFFFAGKKKKEKKKVGKKIVGGVEGKGQKVGW